MTVAVVRRPVGGPVAATGPSSLDSGVQAALAVKRLGPCACCSLTVPAPADPAPCPVFAVMSPAQYVSVSLATCVGLCRFGEAWAALRAENLLTYLLSSLQRTLTVNAFFQM